MSAKPAPQLDETDLEIIEFLVEDGRLSCAEIANRIGDVSERTIRNRLNALIEKRLIRVGALPEPTAMGLNVVADVFVEVEPGRVYSVASALVDYEHINYVACATGDYDISVQLAAPNVTELYRFVTEVIDRLPGVRRSKIVVTPLILKTFGYKTRAFEQLVAEQS